MNLKALRYVCLDINIPDFLFLSSNTEFKNGSNYHKAFCTVCKKATEDWRFAEQESSSHYEQYVYVNCHNLRHRVPVTEGDLERHRQIFRDLYFNEKSYHSL